MFRQMRRKGQALPESLCAAVLEAATSGVLAVEGDDGYPYALPLNFVFDGDKIYFHCGKEGHKIDAVRRNPKASFCVIAQDRIVPEKYTSLYRSVIVFGKVRILGETEEKRAAIEKLTAKYAPKIEEEARRAAIDSGMAGLCMLALDIQHMSGKQAHGLAQKQT